MISSVLLAVLSVLGGYHWFYDRVFGGAFEGVLELVPEPNEEQHFEHMVILVTSIAVLLIGALSALALYKPASTDSLAEKAPGLFNLLTALRNSFDRAYDYYVAKIQQRFAMLINFLEQILLAGVIVRGMSAAVGFLGLGARALHVGNVNAYAYWFLLGAAALWAFAAGWITF